MRHAWRHYLNIALIILTITWPQLALAQTSSLWLTHGDERQNWYDSQDNETDSRGGLYLAQLVEAANNRQLPGEVIGWILGLYAEHEQSLKLPGAKNISPHRYAKAATLTALPGRVCTNLDQPIFARGLERPQSYYSHELAETLHLVSDPDKELAPAWPLARSPLQLSQQLFWFESRGLVNALITGENYQDWLLRLAIADQLNQVGGQAVKANRWRAEDSLDSLYQIAGEGEMAAILGLSETGLGVAGGTIEEWQRQSGRLELGRWLDLAPNALNLELDSLSQYYRQIALATLANDLSLSLPEASFDLESQGGDAAEILNRWQKQLSEELGSRSWPSQSPDRLLGLEDLNLWLNQGGQSEATTAIAALTANDDQAWIGLGAIILAEKLELKQTARRLWLNAVIADTNTSLAEFVADGRPLPQSELLNGFIQGDLNQLNAAALKAGAKAFERAVNRLELVPNAPLLALTNNDNTIPTRAQLISYLTKPGQRQSVNRQVARSRLGMNGFNLLEKQQTEEQLVKRGIVLLAQGSEIDSNYLEYLINLKNAKRLDAFDGDMLSALDSELGWPAGTTWRLIELGRGQSASQSLSNLEERIRVGADRLAGMLHLSSDSGPALADTWLAVEAGSPGVTEATASTEPEETIPNESLSDGAKTGAITTKGGYELEPLDPELAALLASQAEEDILIGSASGQGGQGGHEEITEETTEEDSQVSSTTNEKTTQTTHPLLALAGGDLQSALIQSTIARLSQSLENEFSALAAYYAPELTTGFNPESLYDSNFSGQFIVDFSLAQTSGQPLDRYLVIRQELIDQWSIECRADLTATRAAFEQAINDWIDLPAKIEAGQPNRPLQIFVPSFNYLSPNTIKRIQTTWPESDGVTILTGVYELPRALFGGLSAGT